MDGMKEELIVSKKNELNERRMILMKEEWNK